MAECVECGATVAAGEPFCGGCGTKQLKRPEQSSRVESDNKGEAVLDKSPESEPAEFASEKPEEIGNDGTKVSRRTGELVSNDAGDVKPVEKTSAVATESQPISPIPGGSSLATSYYATQSRHKERRRSSPRQAVRPGGLKRRYEIASRLVSGDWRRLLGEGSQLGDASRAVKEMVEAHLDPLQHEKAIGDFKRESLLLTSLEHPSIPTIYDYFYDEPLGRFYLVMKYISGGDLASRLRNAPGGRIDEKTVADWGMQVADVLEYLHSRPKQIIYRDLKPANLMIDGNTGRVMLIDFGIARWVKQEEKGVTAVGTMGYAPPELFAGRVESRSDVYSLGATMFHLMTGADPQDNPC